MSDLSLGGGTLPEGWSHANPIYIGGEYKTGGFVWTGKHPATADDLSAIAKFGAPDQGTVSGLYSWDYHRFDELMAYLQGRPPTNRMGGIGSQNYENQLVGESDGALFRKESDGPMWYTNSEKKLVYGIPPMAGCYHKKYVGDGYYDNVEGVEQGSKADAILGRGEFYWDEARRLYDVR